MSTLFRRVKTDSICAICGKRRATYIYFANRVGISDYPIYVCGRCLRREINEVPQFSETMVSAPEVIKAIERDDQIEALMAENKMLMKEISSLKTLLANLSSIALNPDEIAKKVASMISFTTPPSNFGLPVPQSENKGQLPILPPPKEEEKKPAFPLTAEHQELLGELRAAFKKWKLKVEVVGEESQSKTNVEKSDVENKENSTNTMTNNSTKEE
ncbi:MAG: hypothetical protein QXL15_03830 [Candidatus Korarchaeota archaeon]